jgi:hypothetical protein
MIFDEESAERSTTNGTKPVDNRALTATRVLVLRLEFLKAWDQVLKKEERIILCKLKFWKYYHFFLKERVLYFFCSAQQCGSERLISLYVTGPRSRTTKIIKF